MKTEAYLFSIYSFLLAIGGVFGFLKASSTISLYMGLSSGIALFTTSHFIYRGKKWALIFSLILIFLLTCFFTTRFIKTANFMPGGFMALIGSILLISNLFLQRTRVDHNKKII
jgi:uncharacterized membrane protein (UPF0136 family)